MSKPKETPKAMDPGAREVLRPEAATNNKRVCWAIKTLVAEFHALFPETPVEYSNYDGRNTALDVMLDLTVLDEADRGTVVALFSLYDFDADPRIETVITDGHWPEGVDDAVLVGMKSNPRTQDSREPFGLAEAWVILSGPENGS